MMYCIHQKGRSTPHKILPEIAASAFKKATVGGTAYRLLSALFSGRAFLHLLSCGIFLLLFGLPDARSQSPEKQEAVSGGEIQPLQIGDTIPEELWNMPLQVVNHPEGKETITLGDYRDKKLIILDFWATWCAPCIAMFPKMEALGNSYKDKLQILSVAGESREVVIDFSKKREISQPEEKRIFSALGLQKLMGWFPHRMFPHYIWLSGDGVFLGSSDASQITSANIEAAFSKDLSLVQKVDGFVPYDPKSTLLTAANGISQADMKGYSVFGSYVKGLRGHIQMQTNAIDGRLSKLTFTNVMLSHLITQAYSRPDKSLGFNRLVYNVKDSSIFQVPTDPQEKENWLMKHNYCYEIVGEATTAQLRKDMQNDLKRYFPSYNIYTDKITRNCWVLKRVGKGEKLKTKGGKPYSSMDRNSVELVNASLFEWFFYLDFYFFQLSDIPLDYAVERADFVDMSFTCDMTDIDSINKELADYDLAFVLEKRPVEMIVIEDKPIKKESIL